MNIQAIKREMNQAKTRLEELEDQLIILQQTCTHTFIEFENYQACRKCEKSEPLYY